MNNSSSLPNQTNADELIEIRRSEEGEKKSEERSDDVRSALTVSLGVPAKRRASAITSHVVCCGSETENQPHAPDIAVSRRMTA